MPGEKFVPQKREWAGLLCSFLSDAEFSRTFLSDLLQARDSGSLTDAECEPVCMRLRLHKLCFLQVTEFDFFFFLTSLRGTVPCTLVTALPIPTHSGLVTPVGG